MMGTLFRQRIQTLADLYQNIAQSLHKDRAMMERSLAAREQQLRELIKNTHGLFGDIQGIIAASLPELERFEPEPPKLLPDETTTAPNGSNGANNDAHLERLSNPTPSKS